MVCGFFDNTTGDRIGRLQIERVGLEYKRQGFLRVAWRPFVVLEGVTLDLAAGAFRSSAGVQITEALKGSNGEAAILRNVTLTLSQPRALRIAAATARLRTDGALELSDATVSEADLPPAGPSTVCFWLIGPEAGKWSVVVPSPAVTKAATAHLSPSSLASLQPVVR